MERGGGCRRAPVRRPSTIISTSSEVNRSVRIQTNLINCRRMGVAGRRWQGSALAALAAVCWWLCAAHERSVRAAPLADYDDDLMERESDRLRVDSADVFPSPGRGQQDNQANSTAAGPSTWSMLLAALFEFRAGDEAAADDEQAAQPLAVNWSNLVLALVLILLMLTTAIGNLFVIVAILIERNLRTIGNYLVLSLAIADLLVALLVMPLASIYLILDGWTLGVRLCDIWTSADVFCCTASILHLLAIALDRYWAVTRVDYIRCQRNERRILFMIFFVWTAAGVISLAPVFGWKDAQYEERITIAKECLISQDIGYQIFATCTTFFFPLTLTLIFYWKIYQVARKRIRRKLNNRAKLKPPHPSSTSSGSLVQAASANRMKQQQQITKNQSIVRYSQRPGAPAKFTTSSSGPALQATISATTIAVTNRPARCECFCHKSNQAPETESGDCQAASARKDEAEAGPELSVGGAADANCSRRPGGQRQKGGPTATSAALRDKNDAEVSETNKTADSLDDVGCCLDDGAAATVFASNSNNSENQKRRQSNLNSGSSCSRCKRNQFQFESQSESLASCSRSSSLQAHEADFLAGRGKQAGNFSSLSSENCARGLASLETKSLDDNQRGQERLADGQPAEEGASQSRKSPSQRTVAAPNCDCCSCTVCCQPSSSPQAEEAKPQPGQRSVAGGGGQRSGAGENRDRPADGGPASERTIELSVDKEGRLSQRLVPPPSQPDSCSIDLAGSLYACESEQRANESGATWLLAASRRLVKRRLGPLQPTLSMLTICWRHLMVRAHFKPKHSQQEPPESAEALAVDLQSTSVPNVGQRGELLAVNNQTEEAAACVACGCPAPATNSPQRDEAPEEDVVRQVATIGQTHADSANLAAAVATTTTIALSTAENLNRKGSNEQSPSANSLSSKTAVQKSKLLMLQQQQSVQAAGATVQSQATQMEGVESKRERKAAKTLAIITGVFVMCWLPFFMMALAMPLLQLKPHKFLQNFLIWLGYFNSMLNPIIYTIFSPDFRKAFKRLLCGSDEKARRKKRRADNRLATNAVSSNGSADNEGGATDRLLSIGFRLAEFSPALARCICCFNGKSRAHRQSNQQAEDHDGNKLDARRANTLSSYAPTSASPNSPPRNIPNKQQSSLNSPSKPKSIITNHF